MAIGINDLDDEDDVLYEEEPTVLLETQHEDDDLISDFLKTKGIDDINNINFEDDNGDIISRSWKDLSREELFNILNTPLDEPTQHNEEPQLSLDEINLLNTIRTSNMTPQLYLDSIKGEQIVQEPKYKIDDYSDDELYLLDLEARVGNLTEEEGAQALSLAKLNEEFYKRQIEGIRKEYKEREDFLNLQEQAQLEQLQQEAFLLYSNKVIEAIDNFNTIGNLDLNFENEDKQELAEFMLSQDETGANYLYQALLDPETLTKVAWFILNGEEAFNGITDYFTNQIKTISEAQYKKGLEDGRKGTKSQVVIQQNNKKPSSIKNFKTYEDLDDDDE